MRKLFLPAVLLCIMVFLSACYGKSVEENGGEQKSAELFSFRGSTYSYSLTGEGEEIFNSIGKTETAVLRQSGYFKLLEEGNVLVGRNEVEVEKAEAAGRDSLEVRYRVKDGNYSMVHRYTFYDRMVEVEAELTGFAQMDRVQEIQYEFPFTSGCVWEKKRTASLWQYPLDRDFPYRVFDSVADSYKLENGDWLYCFQTGEEANRNLPFEYYPVNGMPTDLGDLPIKVSYSLVFEKDGEGRDAKALFRKNHSELGIKIRRKDEEDEKSTLFIGEEPEISVCLWNLTDKTTTSSVSYRVYDYDGNAVSGGLVNSELKAEEKLEIPLDIKREKNGMYYLDVTVGYLGKTYRELYPFAFLPDYQYRYFETSPFGVSGIRFGRYEENEEIQKLVKNLGIANMRVCISLPDYLEAEDDILIENLKQLKGSGTRVLAQIILNDSWKIPESSEEFRQLTESSLARTKEYLDAVSLGNEWNGEEEALAGEEAREYGEIAEESGRVVKEAGVKLSWAEVRNSSIFWMEELKKNGLWQQQDILTTHGYSWNLAPERRTEQENGFLECLEKVRNYLDNAEGISGEEMQWYMSEFGVHTAAEYDMWKYGGANPRIQADYVIREFLLGLSYDVDVLMCYNLIDGQNLLKSIRNDDGEDNFGMFYRPDYYGRIMPKPLGAAYGMMTRRLEGIESADGLAQYGENGYAVTCYLKDGSKVTAAWSAKERLDSERENGVRPASHLWENIWKETELLYWKSDKETVKTEDIMGNQTAWPVVNGVAEIPVNGSPIWILD